MIQSSYFVIESHIVYEYVLSYSHTLKSKNFKAFVFQFFSTFYMTRIVFFKLKTAEKPCIYKNTIIFFGFPGNVSFFHFWPLSYMGK